MSCNILPKYNITEKRLKARLFKALPFGIMKKIIMH